MPVYRPNGGRSSDSSGGHPQKESSGRGHPGTVHDYKQAATILQHFAGGAGTSTIEIEERLLRFSSPWTWGWLLASSWATKAADCSQASDLDSESNLPHPTERYGWTGRDPAVAMGELAAVSPAAFKAALLREGMRADDLVTLREWAEHLQASEHRKETGLKS